MTNLQKTNVLNMALLSIAIIGYAIGYAKGDPTALVFLVFPALIAFINWKDL